MHRTRCYNWCMRIVHLFVLALAATLALTAHAQKNPLIVFDAEEQAAAKAIPEPEKKPEAAPVKPAAPVAQPTPTKPVTPMNPPTPVSPESPVDKLWPKNTIPLFLPSCTGLRMQYVAPCTCVITKLMVVMPHDEFLEKSTNGTLEDDSRLKQIRTDCVTSVEKK